MKKLSLLMLLGAMAAIPDAGAVTPHYSDTLLIPQRAIVLSGEITPENKDQVAILYSREDLSYNDPSAPRFLFLDREGRGALGIGGAVNAVAMYDMKGAIANEGFVTYDIPVPGSPALRNRFGADATNTSLFLKLVTKNTRIGRVTVYVQTNFTGNDGNYGLQLKQAYVSVGGFLIGKGRSTFADAAAEAPTVDNEGPSGQVSAKNLMFQYKTPSYKGLSGAISVELPEADYTLAPQTEAISQRFPDIPVYVQYAWGSDSHIRASAILRELSYRDLATAANHFATGWGVQLSTVSDLGAGLGIFGHATYGHGIASYVNDLGGNGYDLVPDGNGRLTAPGTFAWTAGFTYQPVKPLLLSACYSQAQAYDLGHMASDSYRYGQYAALTAYYNVSPDLQFGLEYLWGKRKDISGLSGHANRLEACIQYNF
ncbi:MAG: porin [Muribaculaceae bacterium]|nr:porin [Muribaculaceae bacterium]